MMEEMNENFALELISSVEEQMVTFQHICMQIFSRNDFADCTLCCADGQLQAHRVILASTGTYMYNMLSTTPWPTPCSHPMLFFKAFSTSDMKLALEYIYTGKTTVPKNKLQTLMNIAREFGSSSLSKAIERAVQSCGVEMFRKRIQTAALNKAMAGMPPKMASNSNPTSNINVCSQSQNTTAKKTPSQQQVTGQAPIPDINESNDVPLYEDDQIIGSDDIKTEPGESMMLELDPSSIVATTLDSMSQQSSSAFSTTNNDESSNSQYDNSSQNLDNSAGNQSNVTKVAQNEKDGVIGGKVDLSKDNHEDNMYHLGHETGDDVDDDDDEEMPITVVDLKSLADPDSQDNILGNMSLGIDTSTETLPANCPWCFQVFTSLTLLQRHIKTHVGKYKPYSCQYCPASFARSAHLKRHIRTHTGEKPFVCSYCNRAFSRQDKLKTHLERHLLEQHLQHSTNMATIATSGNITTMSQNNNVNNIMRPLLAKTSTSITIPSASLTGVSPQKQIIQGIPVSTNLSVTPSVSSTYQYFISNEGTDSWQSQIDRSSKGILGIPGQLTLSSTTISPSTTITPVSSLLIHTSPTPAANMQP